MSDIDQDKRMARHLAARAIVALRANFRVERIAVVDAEERASGITCDWTQAREPYRDDVKLINRGFAFVYVGTIVDQKQTEALSDSISKQLNSDMRSARRRVKPPCNGDLFPILETRTRLPMSATSSPRD
jgi:hypothetical protein